MFLWKMKKYLMENSLDLVNSSWVYVTHQINCINWTLLYLDLTQYHSYTIIRHHAVLIQEEVNYMVASSNSKGNKLHGCFNRVYGC